MSLNCRELKYGLPRAETVKERMEVESLLPQKVCLHTFYIKKIHFLCILGGSKLSTSENHEFLHSLARWESEKEDYIIYTHLHETQYLQ